MWSSYNKKAILLGWLIHCAIVMITNSFILMLPFYIHTVFSAMKNSARYFGRWKCIAGNFPGKDATVTFANFFIIISTYLLNIYILNWNFRENKNITFSLYFLTIILFVFQTNTRMINMSIVSGITTYFLSYTMMTSSNGNIFRVTGHLCGEFTGLRWIPHTKPSGAELW